MKTEMKKTILIAGLLGFSLLAKAQSDADGLHEQVISTYQNSGSKEALTKISSLLQSNPGNYGLQQDKLLIEYLSRDFAGAINTGKGLLTREDVQDQAYQLLGASYDSIASYKDAIQVYKMGLKSFPKSGLLYAQYGSSLLANGSEREAIAAFENGIKADPNISSNYYNLAKLYTGKDPLWASLYGEIFVNLETLTERTKEIRRTLASNYTALFAAARLAKYAESGNPFEKLVAETLTKFAGTAANGITPDVLTAVRGEFIVDWYQSESYKKYPFRLFDRERQLLKQGDFEAYNQWLFSTENIPAFNNWANTHPDQIQSFQNYQRSVIFKPLASEYYK